MRVVGIDLSLTATGLASIDDAMRIETNVVKVKADDGTLLSRHHRLETIASAVVSFCKDTTLAVIESPSYSSGGRGTWDRAGLWWWVVSVLTLLDIPIVEISPKTRAKWSTNNGNSSKSAVAVAIGRLWPDVVLSDDNDSDALVLATIGAQYLKLGVPMRSWHQGALSKVIWPDVHDRAL